MTDAAAPADPAVLAAHDALADRMFAAIEAGDLDAVEATWGAEFATWTNFGGEADRAGTRALLGWLTRRAQGLRYEVTRRILLPDGFVQQHVLHATAADGSEVAMPACVLATGTDGRITRIDEYLDPSQIAALAR
ncbi:MAG: nuclear transport factor 2 family protein [Acidimicrobiales bacterium]